MADHPRLPTELTQAIEAALGNLKTQAIQLRDPSLLRDGAELLKEYFGIAFRLGTIEHEIAVDRLNRQIQRANDYARTSRRALGKWLPSVIRRRSSIDFDDDMADVLALIDESVAMDSSHDESLRMSLSETRDFMESFASDVRAIELGFNRAAFVFNAGMHVWIHTLLGAQRLVAFVGRHAFIVVGPVLVLGVTYSWLSRESQSWLANVLHLGAWGVLAIAFVFSMFKEYVLSRRLRALRLRFERWLLLPVAHRVYIANVQGVLSAAIERKRPSQR